MKKPASLTTNRSLNEMTRYCSSMIIASLVVAASGSHAYGIKIRGERSAYWEFSLFANYVQGEDLDYNGDSEAEIDSSLGWGIGVHYNINAHWNLGFDMAFNQPKYRALLPEAVDGRDIYVEHTATRFDGQFNAQYNFLSGPVTPFIQAGLGWTNMDSNIVQGYNVYCGGYYYPVCRTYANTFNDTSFSYNLGLGLRWDINDIVFLRGAYIQQWIDTDGSPSPSAGRLELGMMF